MMSATHAMTISGVWPEGYEVERDSVNHLLRLKTRFYEVEHDLSKGGAIRSIVIRHGTGRNLLEAPMACSVVTDEGAALSDVQSPASAWQVEERADEVVVSIEGPMAGAEPGGGAGLSFSARVWGAWSLAKQSITSRLSHSACTSRRDARRGRTSLRPLPMAGISSSLRKR